MIQGHNTTFVRQGIEKIYVRLSSGSETSTMKKTTIACIIAPVLFFSIISNAFAAKSRKDYFFKPQLGGWFGPVTPLVETGKLAETTLSGGIFGRVNLPKENFILRYFKLGVDVSYQRYQSKGVNEIHFVPFYGSIIGLLPIDIPVRLQLKWGAGAGYFYIRPDRVEQWDPVIHAGVEISFPAGRIVNIGLRVDYLYAYEGYIREDADSGHFLNIGITLYFNL